MAEKKKKPTDKPKAKPVKPAGSKPTGSVWPFLLPVLGFTFLLFIPALSNGFTNWDDILYVTSNPLLKALNFEGLKAIFTTPVVSNYHPLTILSLALNYQLAELNPTTYHLTSIILHVINTGLVFWFALLLTSGNRWVSAFVALIFGIHPMHVESVAWISERKDLLYTLFYVAAMITYVKYLDSRKNKMLVITTVLGALSLLCKPAAIVLPLSLLAIDYFRRRKWDWMWLYEKLPLFILSAIFVYATLAIQSKRAIASVDAYNIMERICFAGFGWVWYLLKFIVPYPLSALHPFPKDLTWPYYAATLAAAGAVGYLALKVRNRNILFGFGFYTVNLLLVLQLVSIGNAVVAERYTYVPYIGLLLMLGIEAAKALNGSMAAYKNIVIGAAAVWILVLGFLTVKRIPVWKTSQTLWEDVLSHYPNSPRAWTNKGLDLYEQKQWPEVIDHLSKALEADPNFADALEWRTRAYLETKQPDKALADAQHFQKLFPQKEAALFVLARAYEGNNMAEEAVGLYTQLMAAYPQKTEYVNNRGVVRFNKLKDYAGAKADFEDAIRIAPDNGSYYINLSRCYYMMSNIDEARKQAVKGKLLGAAVDDNYASLIGIN